jgi:tripartite-type tricarboxylate transporter receptor subunit TctC
MMTCKALIGPLTFAALWAQFAEASAEVYPSRPITMIVPSAAGGPTDALARILTERMSAFLGQPFVIENNGAAGGSIAVGRLARAEPNGYTVGIGQYGNFVLNGAMYALKYDLLNDFEPVAVLASNPQLIVTKKGMPANDLRELIAWLKANPAKATQGTAGAGSPAHVSGIYFQNMTETLFHFVPYRGAAPAMQDLVAGHIDLMLDQASNALPQVRSGSIRAYAVTATSRLAAAPDIPSVDEAGLPGFHVSVWHGLWAPKATPEDIIVKLNAAIVDALANPALRLRLEELGQEIALREQQTPQSLRALQKSEADKWWPIIRGAGIKAQ